MSQPHKAQVDDDVPMDDVPEQQSAVDDTEPEQAVVDVQSVRILPGSTDKAASFEFLNEGHTLGNALRYIIMKNPDVEMCAYTIPHPSEAKMNVRIQTYDKPAVDALQKGLHDVQDLCDVITHEFSAKNDQYAQAHGSSRLQ